MAEVIAYSTQEDDSNIRFDTTITEYGGRSDDTVSLKTYEYDSLIGFFELPPKTARELARDLNAAARQCQKAKVKK